jgi:ligand-binding sensor domain-containing protein
LWIGTTGGLNRLDTAGNWSLFTMWNSALGSNNIACLFLDSATNDLWAGTINGGLCHIRQDTLLTSFTIQNSGISDNTILGIDKDASGNIYLASPANGMIVKLSTFGWITSNTISSNIPTAGLTCLQLDANDEPWIGSIDHGLLHRNSGSFSFYDSSNSPLSDPFVQCLSIDHAGRIWIGTQTQGVFVFDPNLSTGLSQALPGLQLELHPNPAREWLSIHTARQMPSQIEILSLDGRVLQVETPVQTTIDISSLSPGNYILHAVFDGGRYSTGRFTKE